MIKLILTKFSGTPKDISNRAYSIVRSMALDKNAIILKTSMGKPYLEGGEFHFSISHTESMIAIAIAPFNVGIDIENADRQISEGVAKRFLDGNKSISEWVHFESFSKLHGDGITVGYSKMKSTPHNFCELELFGHKLCVCSFGDLTLQMIPCPKL